LNDEKSGTSTYLCLSSYEGGHFLFHPCPYLPASRRFIERGARLV
jgi:hypothetical protein